MDSPETQAGIPLWKKVAAGVVVLTILVIGSYATGMIGGDGSDGNGSGSNGSAPGASGAGAGGAPGVPGAVGVVTVDPPAGQTYIRPTSGSANEVPSSTGDTSISGDAPSISIDTPPAPAPTPDYVPPPSSNVLGTDAEVPENVTEVEPEAVPQGRPPIPSNVDELYKQCVAKGRELSKSCTGETESSSQGVNGKWTSTNQTASHAIGCGIYSRLREENRSVGQCQRLCNSLIQANAEGGANNNCHHKLGLDKGLFESMNINMCAAPCSQDGGRRKWPQGKNADCVSACLVAAKIDGKVESFMGLDLAGTPVTLLLILGVVAFGIGVFWPIVRSQLNPQTNEEPETITYWPPYGLSRM